ncbi:MAG: hypothetical protein EXS17_05215 [Phycisphaerales bacterium]|nr:hypothetical protein [Phycisphaerales bacterium]
MMHRGNIIRHFSAGHFSTSPLLIALCAAPCILQSSAMAIPPSQTAKLTATDGLAVDQFGYASAVSNLLGIAGASPDIAIVGIVNDDIGTAISRGSANIYKLNATGVWVFEAKLTASDGLGNDFFGASVAIFGNTAMVGAPNDDGTFVDQGSAYIFQRSTAGVWTQSAKLVASDPGASDLVGFSVALTSTTVATSTFADLALASAPQDTIGANAAQGSAYVFKRATAGTWAQEAKLAVTGTDAAANEFFGSSVSIYGDRALVGTAGDDISAIADRGSAYTFKRSGTGVWTQEAKLVASDGAVVDYFGFSCCIFSNHLIIGAPNDDFGAVLDRGSAYIFQLSGTSTWTQEAKVVASDGIASDFFGSSVALQGNLAVATAPNDDGTAQGGSTSYTNLGSAYLFVQTGTSTWTQEPRFTCADGQSEKYFGDSVGIFGDSAIVGADGDDVSGMQDSGSAYIFRLTTPDCNGNGIPDAEDIASGIAKDCNGNGVPDSCDIAAGAIDSDADGRIDSCERGYGDFDLNGFVDGLDLSYILSGWGQTNPPIGDVDGNGLIDGGDLTAVLSRWGPVP